MYFPSLDVHVDNLEAVHEAESLQDLAGDHFTLVLVQLEGGASDGVEEVAAPQVLCEQSGALQVRDQVGGWRLEVGGSHTDTMID